MIWADEKKNTIAIRFMSSYVFRLVSSWHWYIVNNNSELLLEGASYTILKEKYLV